MTTNSQSVIVKVGLCECQAVATTCVHHRDLPEVHAEGATTSAAASQLLNQLTRALDNTGSGYRRDGIVKAIGDVEEFLSHQPTGITRPA